jgi:hypothetical protein
MPVLNLTETIETAESKGEKAATKPGRLNRDDIREELDVILAACELFNRMEPDQVMMSCAGYIARLTTLYVQIGRVEHIRTELKSVRTQEVSYTMEMVRDQYKIASRLIAVRAMDQELMR